MRQMNLDPEVVRIMLIMRRQILSEFGAWISLDDENAPNAIRDYGVKSKDQSLRTMAKQISTMLEHSTMTERAEPAREAHYYRGTLVHQEHAPAQHFKPEASQRHTQQNSAAEPKKPAKKRFYRGQVIKS